MTDAARTSYLSAVPPSPEPWATWRRPRSSWTNCPGGAAVAAGGGGRAAGAAGGPGGGATGAVSGVGAAGEGMLVVVADGSGGSHAGLVAGLGHHAAVLGVDVGTRPDLDASVPAAAAELATAAGLPPPAGRVAIDHDHFGPGYGAPTRECREALDLAARLEGLILDPVYSGKALAALISRVRSGRIKVSRPIVFLHTGGSPALFAPAYADWITGD